MLKHEWGFNNNPELVWMGFRLYRQSGFTRIPTKAEAAAIDDDWFDDLNMASTFVQHVKDKKEATTAKRGLGIR